MNPSDTARAQSASTHRAVAYLRSRHGYHTPHYTSGSDTDCGGSFAHKDSAASTGDEADRKSKNHLQKQKVPGGGEEEGGYATVEEEDWSEGETFLRHIKRNYSGAKEGLAVHAHVKLDVCSQRMADDVAVRKLAKERGDTLSKVEAFEAREIRRREASLGREALISA